jgi:hypothetical protein
VSRKALRQQSKAFSFADDYLSSVVPGRRETPEQREQREALCSGEAPTVLGRITRKFGGGRFEVLIQTGATLQASLSGKMTVSRGAARSAENPLALMPGSLVLLQKDDLANQIVAPLTRAQFVSVKDLLTLSRSFGEADEDESSRDLGIIFDYEAEAVAEQAAKSAVRQTLAKLEKAEAAAATEDEGAEVNIDAI